MDPRYGEGYETGKDRGDRHARYVDAYGPEDDMTAEQAAETDVRCQDPEFASGFAEGWAEGVRLAQDELTYGDE